MCCHQKTQLGMLTKDNNILDIWNGPLAKEIRARTTNRELHSVCTSWNSCPFLVREKEVTLQKIYRGSEYPMCLEICLPDKHCNVGGEMPTTDNPACLMCRRNFDIPRQPDLTEFLCEKAKCLVPYLKQLCVMGIAEPFWKDAVFNIFEKLEFEKHKDNIEFVTNTNGTCLTENVSRRFFEATTKSDISWSIDAATPETHQKLRRLDTYNTVVKHLRRWNEMRNEYGGKEKHKTCIYNNINLINVHEMSDMVDMAHAVGVDKMVMLPTYDQAGVVQLGELVMCKTNLHIFKKAANKAMERAKILGMPLTYTKSFNDLPPTVETINPPNQPASQPPLVQISLPKR